MNKKFNPMSKEFQEEAKRLGLTGNQLMQKYINEGNIYEKKSSGDIANELARRKGFRNHVEYQENLVKKKGFKDYAEYRRYINHENGTYFPMSDNPDCPMNLGIHVAERKYARKILPIIVGDIIKEMPPNNPGFDFICIGNQKIDVKARRLVNNKWSFPIRYNNISDQFLCMGFDKDKQRLIIILLIHKDEMVRRQVAGNKYGIDKFYRREAFGITNDPKYLLKFQKYNITNDEKIKKIIEENIYDNNVFE